jgi:type IV pilus assembly protein PilQ
MLTGSQNRISLALSALFAVLLSWGSVAQEPPSKEPPTIDVPLEQPDGTQEPGTGDADPGAASDDDQQGEKSADGQEPEGGEGSDPSTNTQINPFRNLDPGERITINFKDQELSSILELFSTTYSLNLVYGDDVAGLVTINLYEAPIPNALLQILATNGYTYLAQDGFLRILSADEVTTDSIATGTGFEPQVIFLNHLKAENVVTMLTPMLNGNEVVVAGPGSEEGIQVTEKLGGNSHASQEIILLYVSEETLERVEGLLAQIDVPPLQVLVEATILSVTLSEENKLGVDFNVLSGIDFQAMGGTSNVTDGVDLGDVSVGQNDWLFGGRTNGFTNAASDGLHIGILRNQVGVFIESLERVGNATVLSNPQVMTVNRHIAEVLVGQRLPYLTTTANETATLQSVEFLDVGTSLVFRPFISSDGYVRMEIHPKNSSGLINDRGLPEEVTTQVSANVLVRSGHTVVIGGLMETQDTTDTSQIPLLGSLPFVGSLFRSETQQEARREIIVLLTPHVVGDNDLQRRADLVQARFNAARAQLAASHHGYLRPSYARKMYREAAMALATGDSKKALAKAEWGLLAMPADQDLALLAEHCHREMMADQYAEQELMDALEILRNSGEEQ